MVKKKAGGSMNSTQLLAENHITISHPLFDEGMRATQSMTYKKMLRKMMIILAVLFLAVAAYMIYTGLSLIFLLGEFIFLGALIFWLTVMLPRTRRRSKYKAFTHGSTESPERTVKFYQDQLIVITCFGKETAIPYSNVTGWIETKNLWILNCKNITGVLLDKNGFITGDFNIIKPVISQ
jgi:hypothetical protein